ncbi:MAG TPA: hypothetical protein ENI23_18035 [bacterium]|nr:hypothetical protein [bacterium]
MVAHICFPIPPEKSKVYLFILIKPPSLQILIYLSFSFFNFFRFFSFLFFFSFSFIYCFIFLYEFIPCFR